MILNNALMAKTVILALVLLAAQLRGGHQRLSLQKALDKKLVTATATSLGGYQGMCISFAVKNLTKDSLVILVEPGRRMNSLEDKNQDILIVKQELLALKAHEEKRTTLKGYCCQMANFAPAAGARYAVNKLADSNLVKLARFLNVMEFDKNAEQEAVWAISDNRSAANISSESDSLTQSLREVTAMLKGEELPWYRIISRKYVYGNGAISVVNLRLLGLISYSNDKENYATLLVKDEKGIQVCAVKSEWLRVARDQVYKLDLPIKGLAKGRYSIELNTPDKQLAKREFEL